MPSRYAILVLASCACAAPLAIEKPAQPYKYLGANGRRAALLGSEDGRLEAWVFPIKLVRDFRLAVFVDQALDPLPLSELAETAEIRPHSATLVHVHPAFTVRQTWTVSPDKPVAAVLLEIDTSRPLRFRATFAPEMQPMWPASFGGQSTAWDAQAGVLTFTEGLRRFHPVLGSPAFRRISEQIGHQLPDRTVAIEFEVEESGRVPILFAASRKDYDGAVAAPERILHEAGEHYNRFLDRTAKLEWGRFTEVYDWSRVAIERGWACNDGVGCGLVAGWAPSGAGQRPGFGWYFGGDAMMSAWAMLDYGDFEGARAALDFLLERQRADGKIMHEWTQSAALIDWPKYPYGYYHADTTPLFLYTASMYLRQTGDRAWMKARWAQLQQAWRFAHTMLDEDGLLSNRKGGAAAVETGALSGKVARDIYLQGVWLAGLRGWARIARWKGDETLAGEAEALHAKARAAVEKWFVPGKEVFAFAELKDGTRYEANSAWQGMLLAEGGIDEALARRAAAALASDKLMTPWGARLFATDSPNYNPLGYNDGSVWPFVTSQVLLALFRHGQPAAAMAVLDGLRQSAGLAGAGFLAEYFSGDRLSPGPRAVPHQLFSSVALIRPIFGGVLGLEPDAMEGKLILTPRLPCGGAPVALRDYRVGGATLEADFVPGTPTRVGIRIRKGRLDVQVRQTPCFESAPGRSLRPGVRP
ncbi:MAG: amylo-alpha-1,6-glucosidase [Bryobacteraceae bacterium]